MTLLKDLIDILERVQKGDFVVRLTEGVNRAEDTLRDYVVTPELKDCFDNALAFIRSGLQSNTSKATYLHGSFGSGWDAERFENAIIAEPGSEERSQLIGALIDQFFRSYDTQAGGQGEAFLSLDKGCL